MNFLFIAGCPRSGTTALTNLLNEDNRLILGVERYKFNGRNLHPELFTEERFFDLKRNETNIIMPDYYAILKQRWHSGCAVYVGDKVPGYYTRMAILLKNFPGSKILFIYRNALRVASSFNVRAQANKPVWPESKNYRKAVEARNRSLELVRAIKCRPDGHRVFLIKFESFFSHSGVYLQNLYNFLDLDVTETMSLAYSRATAVSREISGKPLSLTTEEQSYVLAHSDSDLEAWCDRHAFVIASQAR